MIIITLVAVVVGFIVIKQIRDDDGGGAATNTTRVTLAPSSTTVAGAGGSSTTAASTTLPATTTTVFDPSGAKIVVANASTVNGAAGRFTNAFVQTYKFDAAPATNAATGTKLEDSVVYYDPANPRAQVVAGLAAGLLGGVSTAPFVNPMPLETGKVPDGVTVVVMLGNKQAAQDPTKLATATTATRSTLRNS